MVDGAGFAGGGRGVRDGLGRRHDPHLDAANADLDAGRPGGLVRRRDDAAGLWTLGRDDGLRADGTRGGGRRLDGGRLVCRAST